MAWIRTVSLLLLLSLPCSQAIAQHVTGKSGRQPIETAVANAPGLFKSGNVTLQKVLTAYSLGRVTTAENLAVVTIRSAVRVEASSKYLSLDDALKKKLLTVREVSSAGSVPVLQVSSNADTPIFLPFGSILTGGKQDRMLREDVFLQPKETLKINVYCIEQGRWHQSGPQGRFASSSQVAPQSLKSLGKAQQPQGAIWGKVREKNLVLGNTSRSANIQHSQNTDAFKKVANRLNPVRDGVAKQERVCGALVILDGNVVGTEIFASEAYFKKVWPQLFNSYVIDAASKKETVKTDVEAAKAIAEDFLRKMSVAKVAEKREKDLVRLTIESDTCLGNALIENANGRLVNLSIFPRPTEAAPIMNGGRQSK